MKLRIQRTIAGQQYSVNEQTIDTDNLSITQVEQEIRKAKQFADYIQEAYSAQTTPAVQSQADHQMISEFAETKKVLEKVQTLSEQKSVILEACKNAMGVEVYDKLKEDTISSPHFKKVTLHSNETE